ncbi:hypothetical protein [Clostridium rectalis]|uniref:hypothetical protein n=1 Tax=Clostridium rectalis TaxID=2040295 RepID=UPI000F62C4F3|nr:hypothetical protein [Clostridium rectalis]
MAKYEKCILNISKACDNCGKCDECDLNPLKVCNNCGKCLNAEGVDLSSIKIDSILEESEELDKENNIEFVGDEYTKTQVDDYLNEDKEEDMDLIDDIEGLRELLEDEKKSKEFVFEEFPGLIRLKKK